MNDSTPERRASLEQERLREYSRIIEKIQALLLVIVLLSLTFAGVDAEDRTALSAALFFYGALVIGFRLVEFRKAGSRARIAAEIWAMIPFISWAIWFTDRLASPLLNAYFVVLVTSALMLGMQQTMWQLVLVAVCLALFGESFPVDATAWVAYFGNLVMQATPLVLVAYVSSVFAGDIRFWMGKGRLGSEVDAATGLHNLRGVAVAADRIFAHAVRENTPASVLLIEVSDPARMNERHGIDVGNGVLWSMAKRLKSSLRGSDGLARYGENLIVALLPATPAGAAQIAAERISSAATGPIEIGGKRFAPGVSIGLATFAPDGDGIDAVLMRAERALRLAREQGGGTVSRPAG